MHKNLLYTPVLVIKLQAEILHIFYHAANHENQQLQITNDNYSKIYSEVQMLKYSKYSTPLSYNSPIHSLVQIPCVHGTGFTLICF